MRLETKHEEAVRLGRIEMTDIVERLRDWPTYWPGGFGVANGLREAAEEIERNRAAIDELVEALKDCTKFAHRNHCSHDETHRCGAIWEICDMCGAKWADDEGGKPAYVEPAELTKAYAAIAKHETPTTKEQ